MTQSPEDNSLKAAQKALAAKLRDQERAKKQEQKQETDRDAPPLDFQSLLGHFSWVVRLAETLKAFWNGWLKPVALLLNPILRRIGGLYKSIYMRLAYKPVEEGGRVFQPKRAGAAVLLLTAMTFIVPVVFVRYIIPGAVNTIYDAVMLTTLKEDKLYLSRIDIVDADRDIFQVMGCRDIAGCDGGDNTTYYRLRPNIILGIKYWATRFEPYDPAEIGGAMVSELNECTIQYYGRRVKAFGWYPYIISASCKPVAPA